MVGLLPTILSAYFLSIHRALTPAVITFLSRLVGALLVTALAVRGVDIAGLAVAWACAALTGHLTIAVATVSRASHRHRRFSRLRAPTTSRPASTHVA